MTGSASDPDVDQVIIGEMRLMEPAVRRSREQAAALLDPEFREFGSSGREWDLESILDVLAADESPPPVAEAFAATRPAADVVLLTYRTRRPGRVTLRASIWRRRDGSPWRLVFHQGTARPE